MSTIQRIAKNTAVLIAANAISFIFSFFTTMYITRYLGAEGFGILSFATAFTAVFSGFTDIGLQQLMIREIAKDKTQSRKYIGNIAILKTFLVIIFFGVIVFSINILDYPWQTIKVVYLLALSVVFNTFSLMLYGVFHAYERMEFAAFGRILSGALTLIGAICAINQQLSVVGFGWLNCLVSLITLGYAFVVLLWKFTLPKFEIDLSFWKKTLVQAWPFGLITLFMAVGSGIDSVFLSLMKGNEVVGIYNAANRLIFLLQFIPAACSGAVFPVMSRLYISSNESLKLINEKLFKYFLIISFPIGIGTTILANKIIMLIFGIDYLPSAPALQILIWSFVFGFIASSISVLLTSMSKQAIIARAMGGCLALSVVLYLMLIPKYGLIGASIAKVASSCVFLAIIYVWSFRIGYGISIKKLINITGKLMVSGVVMVAFIMVFKSFHIFELIPLSAMIYFIMLIIIKCIDKEDMLLARSIFNK